MAIVRCAECSWEVPAESWNRAEGFRCPLCGEQIRAFVFPAIAHRRAGAEPQPVVAETEASCFYHPSSRAVVPCDECGRFLCALCEIEIDSRKLCPRCFEAGVASNKLAAAETSRTLYDSIALALSTFPILLFWPALIGAPAALWIVVRRWRAPGSLLPRTRIRYYLAIVCALAQLGFFGFLIWAILNAPRTPRA